MATIVKLRNEWPNSGPFALVTKHVLVIDDQSTARTILEAIVHNIDRHIDVKTFENPLLAIEWAKSHVPDLVLVDYKMYELDGIETIRRLRQLATCKDVPIVMVTIIEDRRVCHDAFDAGATDFLVKPFDPYECRARCRNLLTMREQCVLLNDRTKLLEFEIGAAVRQMRATERETIMLAASLSEFHAHQDGYRIVRIARYAGLIAEGLGLAPEMAERIELSSTLLDVGTIGIPDDILLAEGHLTEAQEETLHEHTLIGHTLLASGTSEHLKMAAEISLGHHERYDGRGYPQRVKGRDIPLSARIVAVAEAFDQLTFECRPHGADQIAAAISTLMSRKDTEFDGVCIEALASQLERTGEILATFADPA